MHVHLLTCQDLPRLSEDDSLWRESLVRAGHHVTVGVWGDWFFSGPGAVAVVRSCWDYVHHLDDFLRYLGSLKCRVWNPVEVVRWNSDKVYLRDLRDRGVEIVPTAFDGVPDPSWERLVVKPRVSNAGKNLRVVEAQRYAAQEGTLVQPFLPEIRDGELSAVIIGGEVSHWVRKMPREGDFRVQHFYGGTYRTEEPDAAAVLAAEIAWAAVPQEALYGRLDFIPDSGRWLLSECELIEPWLHFDLCPAAAGRMTAALEALETVAA